jgi:hypothetical protein
LESVAALHPRLKITLLTDEGFHPSLAELGLNVVATPRSYRPSKALYKARALEYFRTSGLVRDEDWILHLDEETIIDAHVVETCLDFIQYETNYEYGQVSCYLSELYVSKSNANIVIGGYHLLQFSPVLADSAEYLC